jgi:hypothetical protein
LPRGAARTLKQLGCTGMRPKPFRTCGSKEGKEEAKVKTRLLFFALTASIFFASWGAAASRFLSWSDGC